jgi:hypothetical protein
MEMLINDQKIAHEVEMVTVEMLSVLTAIDLTATAILKSMHGGEPTLNFVSIAKSTEMNPDELPTLGGKLDEDEDENEADVLDFDFLQTVLNSNELAKCFPDLEIRRRHELTFFRMFHKKSISLIDHCGLIDSATTTVDIDRSVATLSFLDFVKFASALKISVYCDHVPLVSLNDTGDASFNESKPVESVLTESHQDISKVPIRESESVVLPIRTETSEQRRTRWLELYGKGERGAVQRVYELELLLNTKADRSFIGKQIQVAKIERAKKIQAGMWSSQLVQDGKRKG